MTAWWSEERINATVKQEYIKRELGSKKYVDTLHGVLAFGDGLTDATYLDWILERSPRIFLILNQIGVPEKIFEVIDRSFADDDLPLSQDALWELNLFGGKSETLDKKFYREQFNFLIQELEAGGHTDYGTWEVVPVNPVAKRPGIATNQSNDRVQVKDCFYTRKKVAVFGDNGIDEVHFIMHLKTLMTVQHSHLVSVWATYAQDEYNYILLTPPAETTLKIFFDEPPKSFKLLEKNERRNIFLTWIHCLTSALAYLHDRGFSHQAIRPSNVLVDHKNNVFLNDYSALKAFDIEDQNAPYNHELYEHSPPENWLRKPQLHETAPLKTILPGGGRTSRKIPKPAPSDPKVTLNLPQTPKSPTRTNSKSVSSGSSGNTRPNHAYITTIAPAQREDSICSSSSQKKRNFAADIFSHTTILLTLLSQILQHTPKSFASHRSRLNRQAGRGNAPPDSSFHKNLSQVTKWIDMLSKEAGQREKKDMRFWGAVGEIVQLCRLGIKKDAKERIGVKELERKIAGWVDWGLGRKRECTCNIKGEPGPKPSTNDDKRSKPEPASQYRIPQLQGLKDKQLRPQLKQKIEFSGHVPDESAVDVQVGTIDTYRESTVWGLSDIHPQQSIKVGPPSMLSVNESTIWGLDEAEEDSRRRGNSSKWISSTSTFNRTMSSRPSERVVSVSTSSLAVGRTSDSEDSASVYSTDTETQIRREESEDWPLPLGTLTMS